MNDLGNPSKISETANYINHFFAEIGSKFEEKHALNCQSGNLMVTL